MNLTDALKYIHSGDAILFTGAGFSFGAKNVLDAQIPLGNTLQELMVKKLAQNGLGLEEAAEELYQTSGAMSTHGFLRSNTHPSTLNHIMKSMQSRFGSEYIQLITFPFEVVGVTTTSSQV
jgi:hypothetical protein